MIPPGEKAEFFAACAANGEEASTAIRRFMAEYVRTQREQSQTNDSHTDDLQNWEICMASRS